MGYYNDDYFKDFEDRRSSSRGGDDPQGSGRTQRLTDHPDHNGYRDRGSRGYQNSRGIQNNYQNSYGNYSSDRYSGSYDYDLNNFDADPYRRQGYRNSDQPSQPQNVRYPSNVKRKKRLPRRVRRVMIVGGFVLVLVVMISLIVAIVSAGGSDKVDHLEAADIAVNEIVLKWDQVKDADGYHIMLAAGDGDYADYQKITDGSVGSVTVSELEQATPYSFRVSVLKGDKEGDPAELKNIYTLPLSPTITNIFSAKAGSIHVDWSENPQASGYLVEYKKEGGSYGSDNSLTISDPSQCSADITGLDVNANYSVRVTAFISSDQQLSSAPSAEQSMTVVAADTPVVPKALTPQTDSAIDPSKPMIALTFDDGPAADGGDSSERILDALEQNNAKATFFMVGVNVSENPDNVKRKASLGMELGNHTWDHSHYGDTVTPDDIRQASNKIYDVTGQYPTCFRSPGGMTTTAILNECATENMSAYYWSIDTEDWKSRNADMVYHSVMDHVQDGDIILMHEIYGSTADAVERMVPELIARGFQLVTCHDLIALKGGSEPNPGTQYSSATATLDPQ